MVQPPDDYSQPTRPSDADMIRNANRQSYPDGPDMQSINEWGNREHDRLNPHLRSGQTVGADADAKNAARSDFDQHIHNEAGPTARAAVDDHISSQQTNGNAQTADRQTLDAAIAGAAIGADAATNREDVFAQEAGGSQAVREAVPQDREVPYNAPRDTNLEAYAANSDAVDASAARSALDAHIDSDTPGIGSEPVTPAIDTGIDR